MSVKNAVLIVRICQAATRTQSTDARGRRGHYCGKIAIAADSHDESRLHPGRIAAARCYGHGRRNATALGTVVFYGMIGVTFFGLFLTPVFYTVIRKVGGDKRIIAAWTRQPSIRMPQ